MNELRDKIRNARLKSAVDGHRPFIPNDQIEKLITRDLLKECFDLSSNFPLEKMTKVVAILIMTGSDKINADVITRLYEFGLTNDALPLTMQTSNQIFESFPEEIKCLASSFESLQWEFLSPTFGHGEHSVVSLNVVLPITNCLLREDDSRRQSSICKIHVHPAHLRRPQRSQLVSKETFMKWNQC